MLREFEAVLPRHPKHGGGPGIASAGEKKKGGRGKAINLTSVEGSTRMKQEYLGRKLLTHKRKEHSNKTTYYHFLRIHCGLGPVLGTLHIFLVSLAATL